MLPDQTQAFSGLVTVTSANMTKACSNVTVYGMLVVVTCEQAPVTQNLTLEVSADAVLHLCEWRVFGRPPSPGERARTCNEGSNRPVTHRYVTKHLHNAKFHEENKGEAIR